MSENKNETDNLNRSSSKELIHPHSSAGVLSEDYKERDEKPWQTVPSQYIVVLLCVYLLLGYLTHLVEEDMPRVINDRDVPRDNWDTFSEETAWRYLHQIMGEEPRVAGLPYHLKKIKDIKAMVDAMAISANQNITTDWQIATGDRFLKLARPIVNSYVNVSNVIALLEGESGFHSNGSLSTSLLVNCHYDSVPFALGASDNVAFCAVMAETLSRISKRMNKFKYNIIFLFNGAEENTLLGSAGFLHHPWSKGVTAVINLDAGGMNGKATIFQANDPRVLDAYKRVVSKPDGQSVGQFLFDTGVIPSNTDFKVWKDFGKIPGIDIAFAKWGCVYHTRYDHPELLKPGVLQWAGNMLMSLIIELADMDELKEKATPRGVVYYDYLNLFFVSYSLELSYAVDLFIAALGFISVAYYIWLVGPRKSTIDELGYAVLGRLVCVIAGVIVSVICTLLMVVTTVQLRYMSRPWIAVPLYWMPFLITAVATSQVYDNWRTKTSGLNRSIRTLQAMAATRTILTVGLILILCIPKFVQIRYVISAPLCIISAMSLLSLTLARYFRLHAWQQLIIETVLSVPSTMFMYTMVLRMDAMMLPVMGRTPTNTPDYLIAGINIGLAIFVSSTVSGIELLFSRRRLWMVLTTVGAVCAVFMLMPFSPYSDDGPVIQRHYWFHTEIASYNSANEQVAHTTGVYVSKVDAYSTETVLAALQSAGFNIESRSDFSEDCDKYVYCNLPVYKNKLANNLKGGLFLYMGPPAPFRPPASTRLLNRTCLGESCTYSFAMTVTAHNLLTIWPRKNVEVTSWSFTSPVKPSFSQHDRPVYIVFHTIGTYRESFEPLLFNITMTVPLSIQSQPAVDLSQHSHKIHHPEDYTAEYKRVFEAMPSYFDIATFMSFKYNYVF